MNNPHKNRIGYIDNFFSLKGFSMSVEYAKECDYVYGKTDFPGYIPTGLTHDIERDSDMWNMFVWRIQDHCSFIDGLLPYSVSINCFAPGERPRFHPDGDESGLTFIYYANQWQMDDGGETHIIIDEEIRSYKPLANRMIWFDSTLWHRATSRRDDHRFTYAIKYNKTGVVDQV